MAMGDGLLNFLRPVPIKPPFDSLSLTIRRTRQARRLTLRLSRKGDGVVVVAPRRASQREIARFVERHHAWIAERLQARPPAIRFAIGALIPLHGVPYNLGLTGKLRGPIETTDGSLRFPCLAEHLPRRVRDYLIKQARNALEGRVALHAAALRLPVPPVSLRDTSSRWGSCSRRGGLSFSWRLVMAPPEVLDYVAAHEVAHLVHMHHQSSFWELCYRLAPQADSARAWLRANGSGLLRYGELHSPRPP